MESMTYVLPDFPSSYQSKDYSSAALKSCCTVAFAKYKLTLPDQNRTQEACAK